jgi:neutral ceramidase
MKTTSRFTSLLVCSLTLLPVVGAEAQKEPSLRAGAAAVDITPRVWPINMPGGFNANYATNAHDPLHARALVLSDGKTTIALVVADNLGVAHETAADAKALAMKRCGIPADRIMISGTHTHSAAPSNAKEGDGPAVAYRKVLVEGLAEAVVQAHAALRPAAVGAAAHPLPDEVFNRRWFLKPGAMPLNPFGELDLVKMNPGTNPVILERAAGPTDPDITVLSVQDAKSRQPLALFANYALHYVGAVPRGLMSADYFGEFCRLLPSRVRGGDDFVAVLSNGASGDINNIPFGVVRPPREPFEQIRIVAQKAADTAWHAWKKIEKHEGDARLGMRQREITLRTREITPEQIASAKQVLAVKDPKEQAKLPRLADSYARRTLSLADGPDTISITLQAMRIGDLAVCAIPFEVLVEIGLELKQRSPLPRTMVISLANGSHGYLPTPKQHEYGGYETWLGTNRVQKDASEIIVRHLLEMLGELAQE